MRKRALRLAIAKLEASLGAGAAGGGSGGTSGEPAGQCRGWCLSQRGCMQQLPHRWFATPLRVMLFP